jgi:hypothetical protein
VTYKTIEARREYERRNRADIAAKQRERRKRYQGQCLVCGKATDGSNGRAKAPKYCVQHAPSNQPRTHCKRGHPLTADNVYVQSQGPGKGTARRCKTCWNAYLRERYRQRREAA